MDDLYETTMEMENQYCTEIAAESQKEFDIVVDDDTSKKMKEQFNLLKYEQLFPNWNSFYMKVRNHICIFEKY